MSVQGTRQNSQGTRQKKTSCLVPYAAISLGLDARYKTQDTAFLHNEERGFLGKKKKALGLVSCTLKSGLNPVTARHKVQDSFVFFCVFCLVPWLHPTNGAA